MVSEEKNKGSNHEYYVTASYAGKIQGASKVNVDVANPSKQPKRDSAVFSGTSGQPEKSDKQGKITHAYFLNAKGIPTQSLKIGDSFYVRVKTVNMIGEKLQIQIFEKDSWNSDEIFNFVIPEIKENTITSKILTITKKIFDKGIDENFFYRDDDDKKQQQYYIELTPLTSTAKSVSFGIDDEAKRTKVDSGKSATMMKDNSSKKTDSTCICKEEYKDLIWGGKVSCDFRKKVVEICSDLWGESRKIKMANGLMTVMKVETWGSFKAHHREGYKSANDNPKDLTISSFHKDSGSKSSRAVGLIQFTQDALEGMNEFPKSTPVTKGTQPRYDALNKLKLSFAQMGEIKQLDKVKKYFEPAKNKIKTPEDIYLHVFAPKGVGQNDNFLLYAKGTDEYKNNSSVDKNNDGIQRKEILMRFNESFDEGSKSSNKFKNLPAQSTIQMKNKLYQKI